MPTEYFVSKDKLKKIIDAGCRRLGFVGPHHSDMLGTFEGEQIELSAFLKAIKKPNQGTALEENQTRHFNEHTQEEKTNNAIKEIFTELLGSFQNENLEKDFNTMFFVLKTILQLKPSKEEQLTFSAKFGP